MLYGKCHRCVWYVSPLCSIVQYGMYIFVAYGMYHPCVWYVSSVCMVCIIVAYPSALHMYALYVDALCVYALYVHALYGYALYVYGLRIDVLTYGIHAGILVNTVGRAGVLPSPSST